MFLIKAHPLSSASRRNPLQLSPSHQELEFVDLHPNTVGIYYTSYKCTHRHGRVAVHWASAQDRRIGWSRTPFLEHFPFRPKDRGSPAQGSFQLARSGREKLDIIRQSRHMQPDSLICLCFILFGQSRYDEPNCSPFFVCLLS